MTSEKLKVEIFKLSESQIWYKAKSEWSLDQLRTSNYPKTCICGEKGVTELCYIYNAWTGNYARIGSCCLNDFFGLKSDIFAGLKAVKDNPYYSPSPELTAFIISHRWVNEWEAGFMKNTQVETNLSELQLMQRVRINAKITRRIWK